MTNPHGYLMLFPHYLREGVTVEPLIFSLPPAGGPPAVAAMKGRDEIGRPWLGITYDAPFSWLRLSEPIDQHSMERTVGAPDQMGRCFASEELLAHFLLEYPEAISATHLTSVVMHFWSTGQAVELLGEAPSMLWPPLYQGFLAGSHPFAPQRFDPSR